MDLGRRLGRRVGGGTGCLCGAVLGRVHGVIQVADEIQGFDFERAKLRATGIFETTGRILQLAGDEGVPPAVAADRLAERRMAEVGRLRSIYLG